MKIGVTGTREQPTKQQLSITFSFLRVFPGVELHHGNCIGFDELVAKRALSERYYIVGHPPKNKRYLADVHNDELRRAKEYLDRNQDIVVESDILLAAPKSAEEVLRSGTWSTIRYARTIKRPTFIIFPNGLVKCENIL